jgi:protein-S-isoprenylcysteine O-methyltransferase Ste14
MSGQIVVKAIAGLVLFLQLPVPLYWFVVHPQVNFWRRHKKAAYITAVSIAWGTVTLFLVLARKWLFLREIRWPGVPFGLALIFADIYLFRRAILELGKARFVGDMELSGGGEVIRTGIFARIRNPRYAGSFLAVAGACLLAGTGWMWLTAAAWGVLMFTAILLEEREMRARFGVAYVEYCHDVPRFLPRTWARSDADSMPD